MKVFHVTAPSLWVKVFPNGKDNKFWGLIIGGNMLKEVYIIDDDETSLVVFRELFKKIYNCRC